MQVNRSDVSSLICVQGLLDKVFNVFRAELAFGVINQNGVGLLSGLKTKNAGPKKGTALT